jgi:hypothetical protein
MLLFCLSNIIYVPLIFYYVNRIDLSRTEKRDAYIPSKGEGRGFFQIFSTDIHSIAKWFSRYKMDSMELKIDSIINSSQTTKLMLGSNRENGLTVVLKLKKTSTTNCNNQALSEVQCYSKVGV